MRFNIFSKHVFKRANIWKSNKKTVIFWYYLKFYFYRLKNFSFLLLYYNIMIWNELHFHIICITSYLILFSKAFRHHSLSQHVLYCGGISVQVRCLQKKWAFQIQMIFVWALNVYARTGKKHLAEKKNEAHPNDLPAWPDHTIRRVIMHDSMNDRVIRSRKISFIIPLKFTVKRKLIFRIV